MLQLSFAYTSGGLKQGVRGVSGVIRASYMSRLYTHAKSNMPHFAARFYMNIILGSIRDGFAVEAR